VDFEFANRRLERLYTEELGAKKFPGEVVDAFFEVMVAIEHARDERDLRALKHLHFEKLKGQRKHQRSLKLHGGFRMVVQLLEDSDGPYLLLEEIVDYHKG
jgi:proteic killer suppression protein